MKEYIRNRVHELYWKNDINCARTDPEIVAACHDFAAAFDRTFGSLRCLELRPTGFSENDPPHMCEQLTCDGIGFAYQFILDLQNAAG